MRAPRLLLAAFLAALAALPLAGASAAPPEVETVHNEGTFTIGPCPSGVTLVETYTEDLRIITYVNQAGAIVRVQEHFDYEGEVTNPETGQTVKDPAHGVRFFDFVAGTRGPVGLYYSTTVPGVGLVFHDVGRLVRDLDTGEVLFEAGPHDVLHEGDVALFCAALGA